MNLYQAQRHAKDNGYDSGKFLAIFPTGPRVCSWLDAYFGLFTIEGVTDGFVTVNDIDRAFPSLECLPLPPSPPGPLNEGVVTDTATEPSAAARDTLADEAKDTP